MNDILDLDHLERRAWRSLFQDGLADLALGMVMLGGAVATWLLYSGAPDAIRLSTYAGLVTLGAIAVVVLKWLVVRPRAGRVKFGQKRQQRTRLLYLVNLLLVTLFASTLLGLATRLFGQPVRVGSLVIIGIILGFTFVPAAILDFRRLYLYGLLMTLPEVVRGFFAPDVSRLAYAIALAAGALVVLTIAAILFAAFLRDHPLPAGDPREAS